MPHLLFYVIYCSILFRPRYASNTSATSTTTSTTTTRLSTAFMTTSNTVAPMLISVLEGAMGNKMQLSEYYDEWNVTLMVKYINETDPTLLTDPQQVALVIDFLPKPVIRRMPMWFLMTHGLCDYMVPDTNEYYQCMGLNITLPPVIIDLCVGPLIHSNQWNEFQDSEINGTYPFRGCAVSCDTSPHVYGLTEKEQEMVDLFTVIGCSLCFVFILFLGFNQYHDSKHTGNSFRKAPLLQHLPYFITVSLFFMTFCMFISEVVGKRQVLCHKNLSDYDLDYEDDKAVSGDNPINGHNVICGVHGALFYASLLFYMAYSSLFSFVIFRSIYAPSTPLWKIRKKWWHLMICCIVLPMVTASIVKSEYEAMWPMGVCMSFGGDLYEMVCVPAITSCVVTGVFLIGTAVLMQRQIEAFKGVAKTSVNKMRELIKRLILYGFGIECGLALFVVTTMHFDKEVMNVINDYVNVGFCQVEEAFPSPEDWSFETSECSQREEIMHPFWFMSWTLVAVLSVAAQTILSCHQRVRLRIQKVVSIPLSRIGSQSPRSKEFDLSMKSKTEQSEVTNTKGGAENTVTQTTRNRVASISDDNVNSNIPSIVSNPSAVSQTNTQSAKSVALEVNVHDEEDEVEDNDSIV